MKRFFSLLTIFFVLNCGMCAAEVKIFHAESSYLMDRSEPILDARDKVFNDAVRMISEEAGIIVESLSQAQNSDLKLDRMETLTAAVLRVKSKTFGKELTNDGGLTITVAVDAELDTDDAAEILNELREAKNSAKNYEEVLKAYTERKKNFDTVYGEYLGSYQKRIMRKIREGCKLEMSGDFDEALKLYDAAIAESIENNAEISLAYIKRGFIYVGQKKIELAFADFEKALTLNNDAIGVHFVKAVMFEGRGDKVNAAREYRAFVKDADIVYYDIEIIAALNRIVELEAVN